MRSRVEVLHSCIGLLRPGGLVVFQEHDLPAFYRAVPASPLVEQWRHRGLQLAETSGFDPDCAMRLYADFCAAGLRAPQMRYEVPIGGGPDWIGYEFLPDHFGDCQELRRLGHTTRFGAEHRHRELGSNRFRTDIPRYLEFYRQGRLLLDEMVTRRGHRGDINDAFRAMQSGEVARTVLSFD